MIDNPLESIRATVREFLAPVFRMKILTHSVASHQVSLEGSIRERIASLEARIPQHESFKESLRPPVSPHLPCCSLYSAPLFLDKTKFSRGCKSPIFH